MEPHRDSSSPYSLASQPKEGVRQQTQDLALRFERAGFVVLPNKEEREQKNIQIKRKNSNEG